MTDEQRMAQKFYTRHGISNFVDNGRMYVEYRHMCFQVSKAEVKYRANQQRVHEQENI